MSESELTGRRAAKLLKEANIAVNKNCIPYDRRTPADASGIRIGTPAITTRGLGTAEAISVANWICDIILEPRRVSLRKSIREKVDSLVREFPVHDGLFED